MGIIAVLYTMFSFCYSTCSQYLDIGQRGGLPSYDDNGERKKNNCNYNGKLNNLFPDFKETLVTGCWNEGVAPSWPVAVATSSSHFSCSKRTMK